MEQVFTYIGKAPSQRWVSVGYKLDDGILNRVFKKIDGVNREAIMEAVEGIKEKYANAKEIVLDVYRSNNRKCKTFSLPLAESLSGLSGLFDDEPFEPTTKPVSQSQHYNRPNPKPSNNMNNDWKDYALNTEKEKVSNLTTENRTLKTENKDLSKKVHEFEKEMIKKDHALESLSKDVQSKSSLEGVVEKVTSNPQAMSFLSALAGRVMGLPPEPQQPTVQASLEGNPQSQYISNIGAWMAKQQPEIQESFYGLVFEITNSTNVSATIQQLMKQLKPRP